MGAVRASLMDATMGTRKVTLATKGQEAGVVPILVWESGVQEEVQEEVQEGDH